jgi:hypothetical protein
MSPSESNLLSFVIFPALYIAIALGFDMGIRYRVQLMYSATHPLSTRPPSYRIRLVGRHIVLFVTACLATHLNQLRPITDLTAGLFGWVTLTVVYGGMIIRDALNEMKSPKNEITA